MNVNVKPDAALKKKLAAGTLTIPDRVLLALAEAAAGLLPEAAVYTVPIRQDAKLPALFVGFYEIHNAQKLDDLSEYTFGFDLAYWPADSPVRHRAAGRAVRPQQRPAPAPMGG